MTVLVATTCAPYKCAAPEIESTAWLTHAEAWREAGHELFLAAEQVSGRDEIKTLESRVVELGGVVWRFSVDDGSTELTTGGRLVRICTGRNLAHEALNRANGSIEAILFLDTDTEPPADVVDRLLEVDRQLVGFNVPTYCMDGPRVMQYNTGELPAGYRVDTYATFLQGMDGLTDTSGDARTLHDHRPFPIDADVREHWNTAGALLVRREAALKLRWRWDLSKGQTDDPCFQWDAEAAGFGMTWVRHDVVGQHHPGWIMPLEQRGLDLSLHRG